MRGILGAWLHHRRRWSQQEREAVWLVAVIVLSAAVMGFLFVYKPFQLYFDDRKQEAVLFFVKTVGVFSCFVLALVVILLLWTPR